MFGIRAGRFAVRIVRARGGALLASRGGIGVEKLSNNVRVPVFSQLARWFSDDAGPIAKKGSLVELHFKSFDGVTGELIESSEKPGEGSEDNGPTPENLAKAHADNPGLERMYLGVQPVSFIVGYDQVIDGLDKAVVGLRAGDGKTVECDEDECYGPKAPGRTMQIPIDRVPEGITEGGRIVFEDGESATYIGPTPDGEAAIVDLNHALAGKSLKLEIKMLNVEDVPSVELLLHEPGNGTDFPQVGDVVQIHFTGYQEGREEPWECTFRNNKPVSFPVGLGEAFPGLEDGILQMSLGQTVFLNIDARLGPGEMLRQLGVDPEIDLHMKVKLLAINPPQEMPQDHSA